MLTHKQKAFLLILTAFSFICATPQFNAGDVIGFVFILLALAFVVYIIFDKLSSVAPKRKKNTPYNNRDMDYDTTDAILDAAYVADRVLQDNAPMASSDNSEHDFEMPTTDSTDTGEMPDISLPDSDFEVSVSDSIDVSDSVDFDWND